MKCALAPVLAGALAGSGLLAGCASQTTLLLPGEAGHPVGALVRLNKDGSECALNEPNEALKGGCRVKRNVVVKPAYNELIGSLPAPAVSFALTYPAGAALPDMTDPKNQRALDDIRIEIAQRAGAEVQVNGHTSKDGGDKINIPLSLERAAGFREYLIKNGFPADQVSAVGRSSLEPADPADPENPDKNRRIEVIVR